MLIALTTVVVRGRRCHMAPLLYPGQNIVRKKLKYINTNEELAGLAFFQPMVCIDILGSGHSQAQEGATQIFPECTKWRRIMVLEDKQRQLVLSRIAQGQLSSPRHARIMFGLFVKGKESVSDTKCKGGGNIRDDWSRIQVCRRQGRVEHQGGHFI